MAENGDPRPNTIRVMLVDDILQVRSDLCTLLGLVGDLEVVGEACNGKEAFIQAIRLKPDVILMDLEMPIMTGYEATLRIKEHQPACRVIALSVHGYPEAQQRADHAGVDAFIVKGEPLENLICAIRKESKK